MSVESCRELHRPGGGRGAGLLSMQLLRLVCILHADGPTRQASPRRAGAVFNRSAYSAGPGKFNYLLSLKQREFHNREQ